jgi:hypothetical protein
VYRLETFGDFVVLVVVSSAVGALGVLLVLFPTERLPERQNAYRLVSGVLREFKDESPRRGTAVIIAVENEGRRFVSHSPTSRDAARTWEAGRTAVEFFVLRPVTDATNNAAMLPAYGLRVEGRQIRTLREDIDFHNAGSSTWPGVMALALGLLGLLVAVVRWRQQHAA